MIILIAILIILMFIILVFSLEESYDDHRRTATLVCAIIGVLCAIFYPLFVKEHYTINTIFKSDIVQYRDTCYGKVDSVAYCINGKLIKREEINEKK